MTDTIELPAGVATVKVTSERAFHTCCWKTNEKKTNRKQTIGKKTNRKQTIGKKTNRKQTIGKKTNENMIMMIKIMK